VPIEVTRLSCPNCAASLDLRNARSKSIVCSSCGSQIDVTDQAALQKIGQVGLRPEPQVTPFQVGMQGTVKGEEHAIIGRVVYHSDEGDIWDEWLLLSAAGQYRWISDSKNEGMALWEPFTPTTPVDPSTIRFGSMINLREKPVAVRDVGSARIDYLEGELTWKAKVGDTMQYGEADGPNERYSIEWTQNEVEFYAGGRVDRAETASAFGVTAPVAESAGSSGGGSSASCGSQIVTIVIILVIVFVIVAIVGGSSSGGSGSRGIRSSSIGRSFGGGGGGHSGGGK
jgi:hypothetical protein